MSCNVQALISKRTRNKARVPNLFHPRICGKNLQSQNIQIEGNGKIRSHGNGRTFVHVNEEFSPQ